MLNDFAITAVGTKTSKFENAAIDSARASIFENLLLTKTLKSHIDSR